MQMTLSTQHILSKDTKHIVPKKKENKAPVMLFKVFLYSNYAIEMENDIN